MLKGNVEKDDGVKTSLYNSNSINLIIIYYWAEKVVGWGSRRKAYL